MTDDNSLIVRPTSSAIAFNTGGSERLRINSSGHVKLPDTKELQLGGPLNSGNGDLRIYHDGTHSYITNNTGTLYNFANTWIINNYDNSENFIRAFNNGAVELYYDGSKKFETTSGGVLTTGNTSTTGAFISTQTGGGVLSDNLSLVDNKKVKLGASDDLQLYHNGTDSFVAHIPTSGNLRLAGDAVKLMSNTNDEPYLVANHNGSVDLYYDNSKRIATSTTGISVTRQNAGEYFNVNANYGSSGDQAIECSGDLTFYTNGSSIAARLDQDGLKFNADTAAANALDDYEEGTFTPVFANGLVASSYESNGQKGVYTKIGRYVYGTILLHLAAASTQNSNVIDINGLPFTAGNNSTIGGQSGGAQYFYQDGFYNSNGFTGIVISNGTQIRLYRADTGAYLTGTSVNGGREIRVDFSYHAA